jgi:hypothetical protein
LTVESQRQTTVLQKVAAGMRHQLEFESAKCEPKEAQRETGLKINSARRDKQQLEVEGDALQEPEG